MVYFNNHMYLYLQATNSIALICPILLILLHVLVVLFMLGPKMAAYMGLLQKRSREGRGWENRVEVKVGVERMQV